ncbi:Gfo/Idh/MocA family oxidoreductase, partial [Mesorhizobium sp. M2E.F.Ca.ET.166.01.1.1]|uniref:Gfo/Idh/MocA family oxidoreductase n=1 Tax=Mesorhizobium sp. M2E.F.Ca.ET.166.01.1.1 TaxID=2500523 RepID=UPI002484B59A
MNRSSIAYGIIGCGMMGQEHIRNIELLPDAYLASIFEPDPGMLTASLAMAPGARAAASVADLLAMDEVDCILIASPNHCHLAQLEEIAARRPLPVLVEK